MARILQMTFFKYIFSYENRCPQIQIFLKFFQSDCCTSEKEKLYACNDTFCGDAENKIFFVP